MILNSTHRNALISPARSIAGKVELYNGSTLLNTFKHTDALSSFTISRAGDKKFFGFGVCQEIEVKIVDRERAINIEKEQILKVSFIANNSTVSPTPRFYISEVTRDENTNELTVKGYDIIHKAKSHTISELDLEAPYTIGDVVSKIVGFLGVSFSYDTITRAAFNTEYPTGANFDGAETLREVLDAIAEATQTIYFVNNSNALTFKHLKKDADPVLTIRKADYFELKSKENRTLAKVCSATELGDNVIADTSSRNLLNTFNVFTGNTYANLKLSSAADGAIIVDGAFSGFRKFNILENLDITLKTNTPYTFSTKSGDVGFTIAFCNGDTVITTLGTTNKSKTITPTEDTTITLVRAEWIEDGRVFENMPLYIQIEEGETATEFEAYSDVVVVGETQYVRDNPFWELREDIPTLLDKALDIVGGLTLNQFECKWRGNYLVEPGDKIAIVTKDDNTVISYLLDEKYTYNGGIVANTTWEYGGNESESADNPSTLGGALKQTFAKVDKVNKQIELVVSEVEGYTDKISRIEMTTDNITASVSQIDNDMSELSNEVNAKMSAEDVSISIQTAMNEGVERVTTSTGFTFNEEGLHITKSDSEITTSITEDGMTVYKNNNEVLVADNLGVKAEDLHATTFLIIGNNSRLEDYNGSRTGCFWIGG